MMPRTLAAFALSSVLVLGGCQNPDGSTNWGNTLLLGAGVGTAAALLAGAASDSGGPRHHAQGYRPARGYGYGSGYGGGYGRGGYRGW